MPVPDPVIALIREWISKAENDLKTAAHTLKLGADCPTDTVCFHAQQCVEKYIKALLVFLGTAFPKTHDVWALRNLLPPRMRPRIDSSALDRLTDYATVRRYPLGGPDVPLPEAREAVAIARHVRRQARKHLPRTALRRRKK